MARYGEFETTARAFAGDKHRGVQLFLATKSGAAGQYVLKVLRPPSEAATVTAFFPGVMGGPGGDAPPPLQADPKLDFVNAAKAQRRAWEGGGGEWVAPVYDARLTEEEAWYATDFFDRRSLATRITGSLTAADLQHVVGSILQALVCLERYSKRFHGNLKPYNVMLRGRFRALRDAQIVLTDPRGGESADAEQFERADLRSLGEIIYRMVSRQMVVPFVAADGHLPRKEDDWKRLGPEAERWWELCRRLLAPNLSLEETRIQDLARELQPLPRRRWLPWTAGAVLVTLLLAGAGLWYWLRPSRPPGTPPPNRPPAIAGLPSRLDLQAGQTAPSTTPFSIADEAPDQVRVRVTCAPPERAEVSEQGAGASRQLVVRPKQVGEAQVTLEATDPAGLRTNYVIPLAVQAASQPRVAPPSNRPPTLTGLPSRLDLQAGQATPSTTPFSITDEAPDQVRVELSGVGANLAEARVQGAGGTRDLVLQPRQAGEATLTLVAVDAAGLRTSHPIALTIKPANRPPALTGLPSRLDLQVGQTAPSSNRFTITDEQPDQVVVLPNGAGTNLAEVRVRGAGGTRELVLQPKQAGEATLTLVAMDAAGLRTNYSIGLTVVAANRPPVIAGWISQLTNEAGKTSGPLRFQVRDDRTPADQLRVTAKSSASALLPPTGIVLGGRGEDRSLTLTPTAGQSGVAEVLLEVADGQGATTTQKLTLTIRPPAPPPDRPPELSGLPARIEAQEGQTAPPAAPFTVKDEAPDRVRVQVACSPSDRAEVSERGTGADRQLVIRPKQRGAATLTLVAIDAAGQSNRYTIPLTVKPPEALKFTNSLGMEFVEFPNLLGQRVWVGAYEVTQREYEAILGSNPSLERGAELPAHNLSFNHAAEFCRRLQADARGRADFAPSGYAYQLPTDAQWLAFAGDAFDATRQAAAVLGRPKGSGPEQVTRSGSNQFGLFGLVGNVAELCRPIDPAELAKPGGGLVPLMGAYYENVRPITPERRQPGNRTPGARQQIPEAGFRVILAPP